MIGARNSDGRRLPSHAKLMAIVIVMLLAGCGASKNTAVPDATTPAAKPDVTVTVDAARHRCLVALASEAQGSAVPCGDVVSFVHDELRLKPGSIFELAPKLEDPEVTLVAAHLKAAGYRSLGDPRVAQ